MNRYSSAALALGFALVCVLSGAAFAATPDLAPVPTPDTPQATPAPAPDTSAEKCIPAKGLAVFMAHKFEEAPLFILPETPTTSLILFAKIDGETWTLVRIDTVANTACRISDGVSALRLKALPTGPGAGPTPAPEGAIKPLDRQHQPADAGDADGIEHM